MVASARKSLPQFSKGQLVHFIGGVGTIRNLHPDSGSWMYQVEMEMGPEPDMGRIGYETTVMLSESDMTIANNCSFMGLAIA